MVYGFSIECGDRILIMDNVGDRTNTSVGANHEHVELTAKIGLVLREEAVALHPRFMLMSLIGSLIPQYVGTRLRRRILQLAGIEVGHGTVIMGMPRLNGPGDIRHHLHIGGDGVINVGCFFDLNAPITIGNHVALGHEVMILTSSHHIGSHDHRAGPLYTAPVMINAGAWIGSRSIVLPGVTIGSGSVVGAGAIVTKDIPPRTLAGGVPARVIRMLD
jgi:maltose O-acetyltransferase